MAISLVDVLSENNVILELRSATRPEAVREIIAAMNQGGEVKAPEKFLDEVMKRELESSTVIAPSVAFAHARTDRVSEILLGLGRSRAGIPFPPVGDSGVQAEAVRTHLVRLIFVIAVPKQLINDYLVCIGTLARLMKRESRRASILAAATAAEIIEQLRDGARLLE